MQSVFGQLLRPAGLACEKNGNVIVVDSGNNRLQVFTPEGKLVATCGKAGSGEGEFNQPRASRSTVPAISMWPIGRTIACRSCRHRATS